MDTYVAVHGGVRRPNPCIYDRTRMHRTTKYIRMPEVPLTDTDITYYAKRLGIPHFIGVYIRDSLPNRIRSHECGVINLDNNHGSGTHWVCYKKHKSCVYYYEVMVTYGYL